MTLLALARICELKKSLLVATLKLAFKMAEVPFRPLLLLGMRLLLASIIDLVEQRLAFILHYLILDVDLSAKLHLGTVLKVVAFANTFSVYRESYVFSGLCHGLGAFNLPWLAELTLVPTR